MFTAFQGTLYRMILRGSDPCATVASPEGRFHHHGQSAIYTSLTPKGTVVAMQRYLRDDSRPRMIVPLSVAIDRVADLRGVAAASIVWQDIRQIGARAPTWDISDWARKAGAQAMIYSSRTRPDLAHLVLFVATAGVIYGTGPAEPLSSPDALHPANPKAAQPQKNGPAAAFYPGKPPNP